MAVRAVDMGWRGGIAGGAAKGPVRRTHRMRTRHRWTRRAAARALLTLLLAVAAVAAVRSVASAAAPAGPGAVPRPAAIVRVAPGDTLWGIALQHAPADTDPRPWIFRTARLNGLHSAVIVPGQVLRLPPGSR